MTNQQPTDVADFATFLKFLIVRCELAQHAGSEIGVYWLEKLCRERLERLQGDQLPLDSKRQQHR